MPTADRPLSPADVIAEAERINGFAPGSMYAAQEPDGIERAVARERGVDAADNRTSGWSGTVLLYERPDGSRWVYFANYAYGKRARENADGFRTAFAGDPARVRDARYLAAALVRDGRLVPDARADDDPAGGRQAA